MLWCSSICTFALSLSFSLPLHSLSLSLHLCSLSPPLHSLSLRGRGWGLISADGEQRAGCRSAVVGNCASVERAAGGAGRRDEAQLVLTQLLPHLASLRLPRPRFQVCGEGLRRQSEFTQTPPPGMGAPAFAASLVHSVLGASQEQWLDLYVLLHAVQVQDLCGAGKEFDTVAAMVDQDVRNKSVRNGGSHTRNLLRVLRGVDMVRVLFEHILVTE